MDWYSAALWEPQRYLSVLKCVLVQRKYSIDTYRVNDWINGCINRKNLFFSWLDEKFGPLTINDYLNRSFALGLLKTFTVVLSEIVK